MEYGDFQTPTDLADRVCRRLAELGIRPGTIIEPTCGTGAFVEAAARIFVSAKRIIGIEVNDGYLEDLRCRLPEIIGHQRIEPRQGNFFDIDWRELLKQGDGPVLILGNPPWITNSSQGGFGGRNLPVKSNFQHHQGMDALTGKSNFDISEWMFLKLSEALEQTGGTLAVLCKTTVARKFFHQMHLRQAAVSDASVFSIEAARYFGVSVEAALLLCRFGERMQPFQYAMYPDLETERKTIIGWRKNIPVRDLNSFDRNQDLFGQSNYKWRSGIKHDCSEVMEFRLTNGVLMNGMGEAVEIEPAFIYPLLKGADVANGRTVETDRYVLVTQKNPGDETRGIEQFAPKTWDYLLAHADRLDGRKSRIYRESPRFSIFGVGAYSFAPWKVAICGLYKKIEFQLVGSVNGRPVMFDDTVYFLDFQTRKEAEEVLGFLRQDRVQKFLDSIIFWDEKRPIKAAVLNHLKLKNTLSGTGSLFTL
jgi:hypothetical protein